MVAAAAQGAVMRFFLCQIIGACLLCVSLAAAQPREYFLPEPTVQKYAVILAGAAVEENYAGQIRRWALRLHDILTGDFDYSPAQIILLMDPVDPDPIPVGHDLLSPEGQVLGTLHLVLCKLAISF